MLSRSGSCRSFDDGADGFVPGEESARWSSSGSTTPCATAIAWMP